MNSFKSMLACLAGLLAVGGMAFAKDSAKTSRPPAALQLQVELPFVNDIFVEDDLSEALAATVSETFYRQGYRGGMDEVRRWEKLDAAKPVLTVRLINWRGSRAGFIDCVFSAELRQPDGTVTSLGVFTGSEMTLRSRMSRWDLADRFVDAAKDASHSLWKAMDAKALLPVPAATESAPPAAPAVTSPKATATLVD